MMMKSHAGLHGISFWLAMIGALNWGLIGLFNFNLVAQIFGFGTIAKIIYILVGLSAVYLIFTHKNTCRMCNPDMKDGMMKDKM